MRPSRWYYSFAVLATLPGSLVGGCSGDDASEPTKDASAELVARGKYFVEALGGCTECHTPRDTHGQPRADRYLAGVDCFIGVDNPNAAPGGPPGCLSSRNLTNHPTGLKNRTREQIRNMFLNGVRPNGEFLNGAMPYWVYHNITSDDADAIVAYLRTVPGVDHVSKPNQYPWTSVPSARPPVDMGTVYAPSRNDNPDFDSQMRGRYIAAAAAGCIECHTPETGTPPEPERSKWFAGGRVFARDAFRLPPTFPENIYSANLTSHPTGLAEYSAEQIARVIKSGQDRHGNGVCPPMPVGPIGHYVNMTDGDAMAVAKYLKVLPPIDHARPDDCIGPKPLP
ncbi:c-type cytochrome [Pendulispora rubella]|uniref:C-type cytochrome n=1 Tax=Pendulispora rubella TaxID=2741070 RepID=A0ABZ2L9R4_9BACT